MLYQLSYTRSGCKNRTHPHHLTAGSLAESGDQRIIGAPHTLARPLTQLGRLCQHGQKRQEAGAIFRTKAGAAGAKRGRESGWKIGSLADLHPLNPAAMQVPTITGVRPRIHRRLGDMALVFVLPEACLHPQTTADFACHAASARRQVTSATRRARRARRRPAAHPRKSSVGPSQIASMSFAWAGSISTSNGHRGPSACSRKFLPPVCHWLCQCWPSKHWQSQWHAQERTSWNQH